MSLGDEMVFYGSTFQVPFNLLLWTHCYSLFMGGKRLKLKKMLTNPPLIALGLGLFLLVTQLHLPGVIDTAAKGYHDMVDMVAAASMLLVGMIIAGSDLKSVFTYKKAYLISLLRLVVLPVICILLLYVSGFVQRHPDMRPVALVVVIGAGAPCGSSIVQMAVLGGKDAMKASIYNVMSTILCVVTFTGNPRIEHNYPLLLHHRQGTKISTPPSMRFFPCRNVLFIIFPPFQKSPSERVSFNRCSF